MVFGQLLADLDAVSELVEYVDRPKLEPLVNEASLHFSLKGGLIMIEASLGKEKDSFIFDTGAPTLFLNSNDFNEEEGSVEAVGISGRTQIEEIIAPQLSIENLVQENIPAYKIDIQHLEKLKKCRMKGIIGQDLVKNHEVFVDYENRILKLLDFNNLELEETMRMVQRIPFSMDGHFAVLKVKIGEKNYFFGIDTGAEVNVIDKRLKKKLRKNYKRQEFINVRGLDKNLSSALNCKISEIEVGDQSYENLEFLFTDLSTINDGYHIELDGLLGFPFLKQYPFSINYQEQYFYFWEHLPKIDQDNESLTKD